MFEVLSYEYRSVITWSLMRLPRTMRGASVVSGLCCVVALLLGQSAAQAADPNKPHPHKGIVPHFEGEPPASSLTAEEMQQFLGGEPVRKQVSRDGGGHAVAVFRVNAPTDVVWSVISDFSSYPKWIDSVDKCEVYKRDGDDIYVHFDVSSWGVGLEYFIRHHYPTKLGYGTWTLDYSRESDLDDSVGYWRVTPLKQNPSHSRVEYSIDMALRIWVPEFIKNIIIDVGLEEATEWVKIQSEKRQHESQRRRQRG